MVAPLASRTRLRPANFSQSSHFQSKPQWTVFRVSRPALKRLDITLKTATSVEKR